MTSGGVVGPSGAWPAALPTRPFSLLPPPAASCSVDKFFVQCDPNKENLCLYGYPDGTWAVDLPAEEVPP